MTDQDLDDLIRCDFGNPLGRCVLAAGHHPGTAHRYGPQPTDHRTQAEHWLALAKIEVSDGDPADPGSLNPALISISHWLGAIYDAMADTWHGDQPIGLEDLD